MVCNLLHDLRIPKKVEMKVRDLIASWNGSCRFLVKLAQDSALLGRPQHLHREILRNDCAVFGRDTELVLS